jgi:hypothetical protein
MHPIAYSAAYEGEGRNRLTVFFRWIVLIPWAFVAFFYGIGAYVATIIAWFALLFTGKYPEGLYEFNRGFLRFAARVNGFCYLLTDEWPPFGGDEDPNYPVRLHVDDAKEEYSRMKVLFRIFLLIPVMILSYVMSFILGVVGFIAWLVIVFTGELPEGLYKPLRVASAYMAKALGYYLLVTEDFPPFWMDESEEIGRFQGGGGAATPAVAPEPPAAPAV